MTDRQKMEYIVNTRGACPPDGCGECPLKNGSCFGGKHYLRAKEWLAKNGGTMDRDAALERLEAIKKETAELQKIIE